MLRKRVLVIEDDKDSLHAISELLRRAEYEVMTAETGREGLRLLQSETTPDAVVLDSWLPDMTGHALLSTRRRWPSARTVPVLLMTGDDGWTDEHRDLRQLGVASCLRKPFDPEELLQSLEKALSMVLPVESVPENDGDTALTAGAAQRARRLSDLLTRASEVLAQGTDIGTQSRDVARAIVPAYAAACVIERVDTAAAVREVLATQHESAALDADLRAWACQPEWLSHVITEVVDTGTARLLDLREEAELLVVCGTRPDAANARALSFESVVVVPMIARRRLFGVLTCASPATCRYGRAHLEAFVELAHRLALAIDSGELLRATQEARSDQEELLHALTSELQAPLAALSDAATRAQGLAEAASARDLAEQFLKETRRMQLHLGELIELSRLRAGQSQLRMQDLDLAALLRRVLERTLIADGRGRLTPRFDDDVIGLHVHTDPERLAQAFEVLLKAALAHTPDDGKLEVHVSRVENDLQVTLHGIGIRFPTQELVALGDLTSGSYEPANGASCPRPRGGFRLARALIELLGGRFWADAPANGRNMVEALHLSLPLCAAYVRTNTALPSPETVILLVDSDLAFRRELKEILSERGYTVQTADNGLQAWQYLLGHSPPALILFDLVLPAMDGWELHAAIKSHVALQLVPTVVVSGLDRYRIEASLPDAHGYIEKPIRSAQLFEVVQRHVASPRRPRALSVRPSSCF